MYTILGVIAKPLGWLLGLFYNLIGYYGITIILFTVIVKLCLYPLYIKQTKSTVIASCHSISSLTKYDGVDIFYEPYTLFQAPNYQFNLFKMTIKGGQRMSIFDVRIDKFRGISWDWKDDHFMRNIITYYCNP